MSCLLGSQDALTKQTFRCIFSLYPSDRTNRWLKLNTSNTNTSRPRQNGRNFTGDIFKCIFSNENVWILIEISLKFIPNCPINNILALVQIMVWRRPVNAIPQNKTPVTITLITFVGEIHISYTQCMMRGFPSNPQIGILLKSCFCCDLSPPKPTTNTEVVHILVPAFPSSLHYIMGRFFLALTQLSPNSMGDAAVTIN